MAARAIAKKEDYSSIFKNLTVGIESISAFRKNVDNFTDTDFDKIVSILVT